MPKYEVIIEETLVHGYVVEAKDAAEAEYLAMRRYEDGEAGELDGEYDGGDSTVVAVSEINN